MRGLTFEEIGRRLGVTTQAAHATVSRALTRILAETNEAAENLRALELRRLDRMLVAVWEKVEQGDVAAINAALRIGERRARLTGIEMQEARPDSRPMTLVDIFARPMPSDAYGNPILSREPTELYDKEILARVRGVSPSEDDC